MIPGNRLSKRGFHDFASRSNPYHRHRRRYDVIPLATFTFSTGTSSWFVLFSRQPNVATNIAFIGPVPSLSWGQLIVLG